MKMSKMFVQTLREFPSDAEVISHKMLGRAESFLLMQK